MGSAPSRRPGRPLSLGRRLIFWSVFVVLGFVVSAVTGEVALRVIYRDRGTTTIGGPGGRDFDYTFNPAASTPDSRQPEPSPTREPGVTRLAIQGDSITYGVGVKDWTAVYPDRKSVV